jgi:signal transduction histidine kinase
MPARGPGSLSRNVSWIVVLLVLALGLTLALCWQAIEAARSHRAAAEKILRDDAALAAAEYLRRARNEVGYFAYYPALRIVTDAERASGRLPDPSALPTAPTIAPLSFIRTIVSLDLETNRVAMSPPATGERASWLEANLPGLVREKAPPRGELVVSHALVAGQPLTLVFGRSPSASPPRALGFEVNLAALGPTWRKALEAGPLLPAAISGTVRGEDAVYLELSDPWGRTLLQTNGRFDPAFGASRVIQEPGDLLDGLTLRTSIAPSTAASLLGGRLPVERLPWLVLAGALAAGLLMAAILLARRERAVARLREDFVSSVSHELRTPLSQIRLFAETLRLDRVRTPEERRRSLEIIDQEARRLTQLVENALAVSRSERGAGAIAPREQDVAEILRRAVEGFEPLAVAAGARVVTDLPATAAGVVDADALRQVVVNLLDNAVKYGPRGQSVSVRLENEGGQLFLSVEDEGPGVPARDRERIFERFVRLDRDRASERAGAGIGLAVARELVRQHGGTIRAEGGARGGARFVVRIPAQAETPA